MNNNNDIELFSFFFHASCEFFSFLVFAFYVLNNTAYSEISDDNLMYICSYSDESNIRILNMDFGTMKMWAHRWLISFSEEKTKSMLVRYQGIADDKLLFSNDE